MSRDILENISALLAEGKLADLREQLCDMNVKLIRKIRRHACSY